MPYIKQEDRDFVDETLDELIRKMPAMKSDLDVDGMANYVIIRILDKLYGNRYFELNRAMGVLACAQAEFYRRRAVPYEDKKIEQNGDVFKRKIKTK